MDTEHEKIKILVVDDSEMNRMILTDMLEEDYEILEASNGKQAIELLQRHLDEISLMLLDIVMPEMDGFEVLALMNKHKWIQQVPVIMISAENAQSYVERAYVLGVTDYIQRPFDAMVVQRRVQNTILLYAKQKRLTNMVTEQVYENQKMSSMTVNILSCIVEFRNGESGLHVLHVTTMTEILLKRLIQKTDKYPLSRRDISLISTASAMHDIGKISIPDEILNKPGKLTDAEYEIMKTHSAVGASLLDGLPQYQDEPLVQVARSICRWHHERWDGRGYPDKLKGDEIPISAQAVALADVYDALTSVRVYKPAIPHKKAIEMILNGECGAFNPLLLECMMEEEENIRHEMNLNSISGRNERELRETVEEMLSDDTVSKMDQTYYQLERERDKNRFFSALSQEIQFEYSWESNILMVSDWSLNKLGVDSVVYDPGHDKKLLETVGMDNVKKLIQAVRDTSPEAPVLELDMDLMAEDEHRWHHCVCRAEWSRQEGEQPRLTGFIGKAQDTHEQWKRVSRLQNIASHDTLTGLNNRGYATSEIRAVLEGRHNYALILFDLDGFKQINDLRGHMKGDEVLKYIAQQLSRCVRKHDIAARIGGDEFLIFIEYGQGESPDGAVNRLFNSLGGRYEDLELSISMGIATTEAVGRDYDQLFLCADRAMYHSKRSGKNRFSFYDESMKDLLSSVSPIDGEEDRQDEVSEKH